MATVKIKLRPSSVEGKAGVIFYQITHNRKTQHITTRLRVQPFDWNEGKVGAVRTQSLNDSELYRLRCSIVTEFDFQP